MKVKVYVEGGGDGRDLRTRCRMGFSLFFQKANLAGRMPKIIACGSRNSTFDKFRAAFLTRKADEFIVLLVDSEDPIAQGAGRWQHLTGRDGWAKPHDTTDEHAHLMVHPDAGWPRAVAHPRLPQFRACPTRAPGSSNDGLAAQRYTLCTIRAGGRG